MSEAPALQRGLEIIRIVATGGYTLPQLENELNIPKASFGRLMKCLLDNGFINLEPGTKQLSVGDDFTFLAMTAYEDSTVYRLRHESARKLSSRWGVTFVIHEYRRPFRVYWRVKSVPPGGVNTRPVGFHMQGLNCNAQGQLFLAQLPEEEARGFFDTELVRKPAADTVTSYDEIQPRLEKIRIDGYAYQERENNPSMKQIAVPVKLRGSEGTFCLTCYLPLDFEEVGPLLDNMLFETARIGGIE